MLPHHEIKAELERIVTNSYGEVYKLALMVLNMFHYMNDDVKQPDTSLVPLLKNSIVLQCLKEAVRLYDKCLLDDRTSVKPQSDEVAKWINMSRQAIAEAENDPKQTAKPRITNKDQ
jgi:hypothetical protein